MHPAAYHAGQALNSARNNRNTEAVWQKVVLRAGKSDFKSSVSQTSCQFVSSISAASNEIVRLQLEGLAGTDGTTPVTNDRALLERWVRAGTTSQRVARRSRIVLFALDGVDDIASRVGVSPRTVQLWITRFQVGGAEALLHDAPGRGRHAALDSHDDPRSPPTGQFAARRWARGSLRRAAAFLQVSPSAMWRALRKADGATNSGH